MSDADLAEWERDELNNSLGYTDETSQLLKPYNIEDGKHLGYSWNLHFDGESIIGLISTVENNFLSKAKSKEDIIFKYFFSHDEHFCIYFTPYQHAGFEMKIDLGFGIHLEFRKLCNLESYRSNIQYIIGQIEDLKVIAGEGKNAKSTYISLEEYCLFEPPSNWQYLFKNSKMEQTFEKLLQCLKEFDRPLEIYKLLRQTVRKELISFEEKNDKNSTRLYKILCLKAVNKEFDGEFKKLQEKYKYSVWPAVSKERENKLRKEIEEVRSKMRSEVACKTVEIFLEFGKFYESLNDFISHSLYLEKFLLGWLRLSS